jgi:DNA-binding MarR family transcriptional regulator
LTAAFIYFDVEINYFAMASPRSVLDDLPFCFARATLSFRRISDETLRAVGLDSLAPGLASVLHGLDESGDCTINALIEKTHLPNGTLTGLLDTLEQEGYVRRTRNPDDGRSWIIQLTGRGRMICEKLQVRHRAVMAMFGKVLTQAESAEVVRLLEKLTSHMRSYTIETEEVTTPRRGSAKAQRSRS